MLYLASCSKENFSTDPTLQLQTSVDTLRFDTLFTTVGSTSQFVKIINRNTKGIVVEEVRLMGGGNSRFKINADGVPGPSVKNISIAPHDSAYVYVTVTIDPSADSLPFLVRDSVEIRFNGNTRRVQLEAFGQNAVFIRNGQINFDTEWRSKLPYVILGPLTVNAGARLTIHRGCKVYLHADAPLVVRGSLVVEGGADSAGRVLFTGDRLDLPYRNFPGSFPGIVFTESSSDNRMRYAQIRNAYQGIVAAGLPGGAPKLVLQETVIDNAYEQGIWALNTSIDARNLVVSNCGQNVLLFGGGDYNFNHCTFAAYATAYLPHKKRVLTVTDYFTQGNSVTTLPLKANFTNCIIWGEAASIVEDEILVEKKGAQTQTVLFSHVLWRLKNPLPATLVKVSGNVINADPQFDSINSSRALFNFRLKPSSPAIDAGISSPVLLDLDGSQRPKGAAPDLGAYEKR